MKVILLADVKNVGKKGEVKEVSDGYGRNYLIRNRMAVEATRKSMEILQKQNDDYQARQDALRKEAQALKEKLEVLTLDFRVKTGSEGKMFGSVSPAKICESLEKDYGYKLDKRKFVDSSNITELGRHDVRVELFKDVIATLKVNVISL